jgi:hypothetical protein
MVECELVRIIIDEHHDEQVIFLRERGEGRVIPILIGIFEATVIDRILKERKAERPLTHDLLCACVASLGGRVKEARIERMEGEVFFAKLVLERAGVEAVVDARPSDAIAVALREGVPIRVAADVLARAGRREGPGASS